MSFDVFYALYNIFLESRVYMLLFIGHLLSFMKLISERGGREPSARSGYAAEYIATQN